MPRFFSTEILDKTAFLSAEDSKHIAKVLRLKEGDRVTLCNGMGTDYNCTIKQIADKVELSILSEEKNFSEPAVNITLYQCLPKGDKLEFIVQKAVELGAFEIVPIMSKYCVSKSNEKDFEKKRERLQKIAFEAAKQSGRGVIPRVGGLLTFKQAVATVSKTNAILFYEGGGKKVGEIIEKFNKNESISVFVGSEGGFCEEEIILAKENGIETATLGKLILRCETAPIVGLTLVLHEFFEM